MATYVIGDVQGCYQELMALLKLIKFNSTQDKLWFVGDLVNRGPDSLEVLRFVKDLGSVVVLGNHDLHLLALFNNADSLHIKHTLHDVLTAKDAKELIDWLRARPLLHYDSNLEFVMTHAGIYPGWDLAAAKKYALEVESVLKSDNYHEFLLHMYGDQPDVWSDDLTGIARLRFIINSFTRMRFCNNSGKLDLKTKEGVTAALPGFMPWFKVPWRKTKDVEIIFGHWAALEGKVEVKNVFALDTGCVWGGSLTAMRLEGKNHEYYSCSRCTHT